MLTVTCIQWQKIIHFQHGWSQLETAPDLCITLTRQRCPLFCFSSDERDCHIKLQFNAAWLPDINAYI